MIDVTDGRTIGLRSLPGEPAHTYGTGQLMIGTLLMLFFGLPSMTRSL
jgi:hypothetical protein